MIEIPALKKVDDRFNWGISDNKNDCPLLDWKEIKIKKIKFHSDGQQINSFYFNKKKEIKRKLFPPHVSNQVMFENLNENKFWHFILSHRQYKFTTHFK